jgi:hypothetical protein
MPQPNTSQKSKEKFFTPGLDKFGLIEAQGFNPGLGVLMRCALKGHQNAARRVAFISPPKRSVILAPLSGEKCSLVPLS